MISLKCKFNLSILVLLLSLAYKQYIYESITFYFINYSSFLFNSKHKLKITRYKFWKHLKLIKTKKIINIKI